MIDEKPETPETPETPEEAVDVAEAAADKAEAAAEAAEQAETPQEAAAAATDAAEAAEEAAEAAEVAAVAEATEEKPKRRRGARKGSADAAAKKQRSRRPKTTETIYVRAQAKYVRSSPRKARLVVDHIRGKSVEEARAILAHTPRAAAVPVLKVLESAIANAEHNHELLPEELRVFQVMVDEGPTIKRFRPRALGRATKIRKRTSHITINLTNKA